MNNIELIIIIFLSLGIFITWYSEALGSYIKLISMSSNRNVVGSSLVQAAGVLSRLGFFMQSFAFAWIIDSRLFMDSRLMLVIFCLIIVLISLTLLNFTGRVSTDMLYLIYYKLGVIKKLERESKYSITLDFKIKPNPSYLAAYLLLYLGSFSSLLIQTMDVNFAARSVALSGVINGLSTIVLLSYIEVKFAHDVEEFGFSLIPMKLILSRYYALGISITLLTFVLLIKR
jgi:hypothetical protein